MENIAVITTLDGKLSMGKLLTLKLGWFKMGFN